MHKISQAIVTHCKPIVIIALLLMVIGGFLSTGVSVNLDNASYLPNSMNSKQAIQKLDNTYGMKGTANLLLKNKTVSEVMSLKEKILAVEGVKDAIWMDTFTDITVPISFMDQRYVNQFYKDGQALVQILFIDINDSELTIAALDQIETLLDEDGYLSGPSTISRSMVKGLAKELPIYSTIGAILILIILFSSTSSWLEPILFMVTIGVSILLNMGLNIFKGSISQMSFSSASLLQLAVSMDYMIFLLHRFHEERAKGYSVQDSMVRSMHLSFRSIAASAATTIAGFLALIFMAFGIGGDLGVVLARGVFLSLISVMVVLPALIILFDKWVEKFTHKELNFNFNRIANWASKGRISLAVIFVLIAGLFFLAQSHVRYYYANDHMLPSDDSAMIAQAEINKIYGTATQNILLIPKGDVLKELSLVKDLESLPTIDSVSSLHNQSGAELPDMMLPGAAIDSFNAGPYTMLILMLTSEKESPEAFAAVEEIRAIISRYYEDYAIGGEAFTYKDLKDVTDRDFIINTFLSIAFIFIILFLTFRSLFVPLLTVFVIEAAIWINLGIAYFMGSPMSFISFVILGAIQLGATVDYAILYINRYKENLEHMKPTEAAKEAIITSAKSILVSASILTAATFSIYFIASIKTASEMCLLIGRGAIISALCVIFVLPGLLLLLEPVIKKTSKHWPTSKKFIKKSTPILGGKIQ